jgi:hypothetical protein
MVRWPCCNITEPGRCAPHLDANVDAPAAAVVGREQRAPLVTARHSQRLHPADGYPQTRRQLAGFFGYMDKLFRRGIEPCTANSISRLTLP